MAQKIKDMTEKSSDMKFNHFLAELKNKINDPEDIALIKKAYFFAEKAHRGALRYNGDSYITHPLRVAEIVHKQIGLGTTGIVAALLHDVPDKTEYTTEDVKNVFGDTIFLIVKGLSKIKNTEFFENHPQASELRQVLLSMSEDIRVIFIKIADKLHNLQTVNSLPPAKQKKIVEEALHIYAPLAHRLGLYDIKDEMEDICLRTSNPAIYQKIIQNFKRSEEGRNELIKRFIRPIQVKLDAQNIECTINGRLKSAFSIWKKMETKKVNLDEIYDLFAIRIIYKVSKDENENAKALQIASIISDLYTEKDDRRRNWLYTPRDTGYRALHLTVMSQEGRWVEVQIRSEAMHEIAEHGLAAHWKYKGVGEKKNELDEKVREILTFLSENKSSGLDFVDSLNLNLFTPEIYVFTPKGEVKNLPQNAGILDFAFKIHTDLAFNAIAGKINGQIVPLHTRLKNGDQVEILTSRKQSPKKEWMEYVITHKALSSLNRYFREDKERNINKGKEILAGLLAKSKGKEHVLYQLVRYLGYNDIEKFYEAVGDEKIPLDSLIKGVALFSNRRKQRRFWRIGDNMLKDNKTENSDWQKKYVIAGCCTPLPGSPIIGMEDKGLQKIFIHQAGCPTALAENALKHNQVAVNWTEYSAISEIKKIYITGIDRPGMISKISGILYKSLDINIDSFLYRKNNHSFSASINLYTTRKANSQKIKSTLLKIPEVQNVEIED
ncbi:MAG: GTP pyrophosphokinase [Bacteroidia bacterium]|nr:MAG: GTP pyrophosphokinase [Bacteroidia bacterium]